MQLFTKKIVEKSEKIEKKDDSKSSNIIYSQIFRIKTEDSSH